MAHEGGTMQAFFYKDFSHGSGAGDKGGPPKAPRPLSSDTTPANPNALLEGGPKFCGYCPPQPSDDDLLLLAQVGVTHAFTWFQSMNDVSVERLSQLKQDLAQRGIVLYNVGCFEACKNPAVVLGLDEENRKKGVQRFCEFIRMLSSAGISLTTFTWEGTGTVASTGKAEVRGGATGRYVDADVLIKADTDAALEDSASGATLSEEHLWQSLERFLADVLPVAESLGVRLAVHPNDPPVQRLEGIPCLFRNFAAFKRLFRMAGDSPALGMEFCCGTIMEGLACASCDSASAGEFGSSVEDMLAQLAEFIDANKVFVLHLRNTTASLPRFAETFIDDGFVDVYRVIKLLVQRQYTGTVVLDHTPAFAGVNGAGMATAFTLGYIKALLRAAQVESA